MREIEKVMSKLQKGDEGKKERDMEEATIAADDEYYAAQTDRSRINNEFETLQQVHEKVLKQYQELKDEHVRFNDPRGDIM
jgi:predicted  nucleic acid-binding Zn-ribbon protein